MVVNACPSTVGTRLVLKPVFQRLGSLDPHLEADPPRRGRNFSGSGNGSGVGYRVSNDVLNLWGLLALESLLQVPGLVPLGPELLG